MVDGGYASWAHRARSAGGRVLGQALGADHLSTEAVVAFVDGELGAGAHQRAGVHVRVCVECAADVRAQVQARAAVRDAQPPTPSLGLLGLLQAIPELDGRTNGGTGAEATAGRGSDGAVVLDEYGAWVSVLRAEAYDRDTASQRDRARHRGLPLAVVLVAALGAGILVGVPARAPGGSGTAAPLLASAPGVHALTRGADRTR